MADARSRIVDENVETTQLLQRGFDHVCDGYFVSHIDRDRQRLCAEHFDVTNSVFGFRLVAPGNDDACACTGKTAGHAEADAAIAAGDDGDLAGQIEGRCLHVVSVAVFAARGDQIISRPYRLAASRERHHEHSDEAQCHAVVRPLDLADHEAGLRPVHIARALADPEQTDDYRECADGEEECSHMNTTPRS
ncbi:hypothetical protein HNQ36_001170 [Afipia massiliensis]|uniref:Uncharacterized protein n=1 Tax=Afipia massiliensis TaxID=211460 RepID=A0A840N3A4_9BRAD|nr:hypothetical protein [Afipia massiliensis]